MTQMQIGELKMEIWRDHERTGEQHRHIEGSGAVWCRLQ